MRFLTDGPLLRAARGHYDQPHRFYHDVRHLDELVDLAARHAPDLDDAEQIALLFHDGVYVPGAPKGQNEALSAMLMRATVFTLADEGAIAAIPAATLDDAAAIISATTHAGPPPDRAARVCDLDLWRLAAPWRAFLAHGEDIRREYRFLHASDEAFWTARHAFYRSMLDKPALFATPRFRDGFEPSARDNLRQALVL